MHPNLFLNISVRYWQDFQDTLAKAINTNIYIFDANVTPFSHFSLPVEICQDVNGGKEPRDNKCMDFYKLACASLGEKDTLVCPYGIKLCAYRLGSHTQKIGYLIIAPAKHTNLSDREEEIAFVTKAQNVYRTVNEVFNAILERNLLGLRRLELNSIYEISRLMTSIIELDKVLELITNSLIIIYQADLCFIGLREGDKVRIAHGKGVRGSNLLIGKEWPLVHPVIEQVSSQIEPTILHIGELKGLPGFNDVEIISISQVIIYPLWTALGLVGLLGIATPASLDDIGYRNLQIYTNFAAVALANATLVRRLEKEATTDFLTGFLNKRALQDVLAVELQRAARYGYQLSVIFLDIDGFKAYNDTYGHLAGDVVLQKVAELIKNSIRVTDIACRYGGEEFLLILPGTKGEDAARVADRIRRSVENYPFPHRQITVSLGVTSAKKNDSVDMLLARADQACYQAKELGKNRIYLDPS